MNQSQPLYRCELDGKLLREKDIFTGKCLGHRVKLAGQGTFLEWLIVKYWKLTGRI